MHMFADIVVCSLSQKKLMSTFEKCQLASIHIERSHGRVGGGLSENLTIQISVNCARLRMGRERARIFRNFV